MPYLHASRLGIAVLWGYGRSSSHVAGTIVGPLHGHSRPLSSSNDIGRPPDEVRYDLEESLDLLAALEDARDALTDSDRLAVVAQLEHQVAVLSRKLGF